MEVICLTIYLYMNVCILIAVTINDGSKYILYAGKMFNCVCVWMFRNRRPINVRAWEIWLSIHLKCLNHATFY